MPNNNNILEKINTIKQDLLESGYFSPGELGLTTVTPVDSITPGKIDRTLDQSWKVSSELRRIASFVRKSVVDPVKSIESKIEDPEHFRILNDLLEKVLDATDRFRKAYELVPVYGDLLSLYLMILYRSGFAGQESAVVKLILNNIARRKVLELSPSQIRQAYKNFEHAITVAVIAKRYAVYVICYQGFKVLFRSEIEFRTYGTSPESLALQITNIMLKNGIKLSDVTDIVCGGGDLGTLPDGIYVLTEKVRDESWKRLHNSSLNRGALVAWELKELLRHQGEQDRINASLCSPLSFCTLHSYDQMTLFREESREIKQSLKGYVKVTPLKSIAALLSEIQQVRQEQLNMLVMTLDELFASAARKMGPRIIRELAAQDANTTLINFDFGKIVDHLDQENFVIPPHFRLASREIGTGVKEICELLMIVNSGKISPALARSLNHVVDCYAKSVAMVLEMASAGHPSERPQYLVITSMMASEPYFQELFDRIRTRVDNPFTPIICVDSMEHEYLVANHLFELYVNPAKDKRLHYTIEERSIKQALQVIGSSGSGSAFSFSGLLDRIMTDIDEGVISPADLVLVGGDNEDSLIAAASAKEQGLLNKLALIGDPDEINKAIKLSKVPIEPGIDPKIQIVPINPLAVDAESKKVAIGEAFREFLTEHDDYIIMKGGVDTATLLHQALSIYKSEEVDGKPVRKFASHTGLFVLPDGRFYSLTDAAVNPGFRNADAMLKVVENLLDVVRKVVDKKQLLRVAIITAVEKETSAIPSTLLAGEVEDRAGELEPKYGPLILEGPLSFDLATVPDVAEEKKYHGKIQGNANCLVATDINTANVIFKMLSRTMGSLGLLIENGGIITAGPGTSPIVLVSRGDTAQTKFNSILLAMAYCAAAKEEKLAESGKFKVISGGAGFIFEQ